MELRGIVRAAGMAAAAVWAVGVSGCGIDTDTLIDKRDGKTYRTVIMPDGKRWMAENLNYKTDSSWCYDNADSNCVKYGRLYAWNAAKKSCPVGYHLPSRMEWDNLAQAIGGAESPEEFGIIEWHYACKELTAKSGWNDYDGKSGNGTDYYGFSALPGGGRNGDDGSFVTAGDYGLWWTASKYGFYEFFRFMFRHYDRVNSNYNPWRILREYGYGSDLAYFRFMFYHYDVMNESYNHKSYGLSVRCVANY